MAGVQIAMLNGLVHGQMDDVPREGDIPTPEELVAYSAERAYGGGQDALPNKS